MPYEINWEENGVVVKFRGTFTFEVNNDASLELLNSNQLEGLKYIIWDLSDISKMGMTIDDAVLAAMQDQLVSSRLPHVKMALIATDQSTRNVCYEYVTGCRNRKVGWSFKISHSMDRVRTWIAA
jgi:hypothetical protein